MNTPAPKCPEASGRIVRQPEFTTREDEAGACLLVALPGVLKENLKITVNPSVLLIEATRSNKIGEGWKTHSGVTKEVIYSLNVRLTNKLDPSNSKASLSDGVLTLDIPVREDARSREIYVN
jgi:HSP20 family protein